MLKNNTCLVTGCAGFIGSHLTEKLLKLDCTVIGIDSYTDYYSREVKEHNLSGCKKHPQFNLIKEDLNTVRLSQVLKGWSKSQLGQSIFPISAL
jgi:nucleoside-diphosphate-sugar epimerase